MTQSQSDTERYRVDISLEWDRSWLAELRKRSILYSRRELLGKLGESGLRRLFDAGDLAAEEFETYFAELLEVVR